MKPPPRGKTPKRPRRPRRGDGTGMLWLAALIAVVMVGLVAVYFEVPGVKTWLFGNPSPEVAAAKFPLESLPQPSPAPSVPPKAPVVTPPPTPQPTTEEVKRKLREQADAATRKLEQATAAAQPTNAPAPMIAPAPGQPPIAPPAHVAPARALPVDLNVLTTERIAAYQVALERVHFSCGFVDGDQGMRTQRMLRAYQKEHELPVTGFLDPATRAAIGEPGDPFLTYTVKEEDVTSIMPKPQTWREKAKATRLGYNDIWELLAEKFHCTRGYLHALNPDVHTPVAGTQIVGPKVFPATPLPHAASLRIYLGETSLEALDARGHVIAFFPCTIAKDKNKRPHGELTVKVVDDHPDYTFDPALFADASKAEGITHKLSIPPGPRNPVGTTWVGLSLPGYGIHGTPDPEAISRTQSHGCFRLANWNAEKVLKMVSVGTPVDVEP
jgi:lipoprotein-anchoring transpeptidase ErfK/SrfK